MRRTEETLAEIYGQIPHGILPAFREIDFGTFECHTYEELKEEPSYQAWLLDFETAAPPEGESFASMKERVLSELSALCKRGEDALVVTHGGPIAAIMLTLFPEEGKNFYEWNPRHGEGFLIGFSKERGTFYHSL